MTEFDYYGCVNCRDRADHPLDTCYRLRYNTINGER